MNKIKAILSFLVVLTLFHLLIFYIGWNVWHYLRVAISFDFLYPFIVLIFLFSYAYIIGRFVKFLSIFHTIGSIWMAIIQYAVILFPIANISVLISVAFSIPTETAILWTGHVTLIVFLLIFGVGTFNAYSPVVRNYQIKINKTTEAIFKLRIAMASDMHFGTLSDKKHARRLVKIINNEKPDIILLPGDIIDDDPIPFIKKGFGKILSELHAPLGIYGVLGNHEYYGRAIPTFMKEMEKINIDILTDDVIQIKESFYLIGRKDKTDKQRLTIKELLAHPTINHSKPIIMMDHQPSQLNEAMHEGVDLILSGHTHRGQMAPNHLITRKIFELDWGYLQKNQLHAIVSSGFGFWGPPIRLGSRSEIVIIDVNFN
ncbi:metallophosphoesterase [Litchfieldia alkalitelluris]|uniref:metallophosphoesterase n=1 Tax=Litchfieldia alkalitelluris TaxID=304268 RepID=UPI000997A30C|nr:metallophosphoesterase [Litchfieldia alkalitelluris]